MRGSNACLTRARLARRCRNAAGLLVALALVGGARASAQDSGLPQIENDTATDDPLRADAAWRLDWSTINTLSDIGSKILLFKQPSYKSGDLRLEANWGIFWLDEESRFFGNELVSPSDLESGASDLPIDDTNALAQLPTALRGLLNEPMIANVRELYFEGPIEYYDGNRRIFSADALYLDRIDGHGWVAGARYSVKERIGGSSYVLNIYAKWLRISADGSLQSSDARITTSEFAIPSYTIESGDLRMEPTDDPDYPWRVRMRDNKLRFGRAFALPLPPLSYLADEDGEPTFGGVRVGDEARFGTVLGIRYSRDTREEVGKTVNRWLGGDPDDFRSRFKVDLTWLGSRGLLTDLETRLSSPGHYEWNIKLAGLPDGDRDLGLARVPESQRDTWRLWLRSRGRFQRAPGEYVEIAFSRQSDPGVQSEFFEKEYLEFEERESYVHWRRARGREYTSVTVSGTLDEFRSEVTRLPEVRYVTERTQLGTLFGHPLLWRQDSRAGYLDRREGNPIFEPDFPDGFGEVSTLRLNSDHRFEVPLDLGRGGLRAIPRVDANFAGWSGDGLEDDEVGRALATAAMRVTSSYWRGSRERGLIEFAPWIEGRSVFVEETSTAIPAVFDPDVELRESGDFVELGLRTRYSAPRAPFELDLETRMTRASNQDDLQGDRWLPVAVLGSVTSEWGLVPWRLEHDGRYDTNTGRTRFSRSTLELFPREDVDIDVSFSMGRDAADVKLFEAVTIGALYRFTPKWDIYGRQSWSLAGQSTLSNEIGVRRYGHDLLFELELRRRTGEGSSIGISVKPLFSARKRSERRLDAFR